VSYLDQLNLPKPFSDLRILGLQADDAACGNYRIRFPLQALEEQGAHVRIHQGVMSLSELAEFDIILAQRQFHEAVLEMLQTAQHMEKTVLFEIDDNVHAVHRNSPVYNDFRPGSPAYEGVRMVMQKCDGLFTSSAELASQYADWSKRTWVLPNCVDIGIRDWDTPIERHPDLVGKVVIGWAGSITHQDDWAPLMGVIPEVLEKYPQAVFALVSAYQTVDIFVEKLQLPADRIVRLDPVPFARYPELPAQFDIGLAPVVNTEFNRAKSDLKLIEYGCRRVPYVASRIAPYSRLHMDTGGQGGYLCNGRQEWVDAISTLIECESERQAAADFMYEYVREERSIKGNAYRWAEAMREAVTLARHAPEVERKFEVREKPGRNDLCPCGSEVKYKKCCSPAWG
jgi:glycosyltransferase involved in cell wall biosynthesis